MIKSIFVALLFFWTASVAVGADLSDHQRGMVSTAHPLATMAAESIFEIGGNSVDAAIAASLALSVVEPSMSGLGGRAKALVRLPNGTMRGYNGMTEIPAGFVLQEDMLRSGYTTIATPGLVAMLKELHENHGSLPFEDLVSPAIMHADRGFTVLPGGGSRLQSSEEQIREDAGMSAVYLNTRGEALKAGDLLKQPALARTLKRLSERGLEDFYQGDIAKEMSADVLKNGGFVTVDDLKAYEVLPGRYITFPYREYQIHTLAAPGGGGLVARALQILSQFNVNELSERSWALLVAQALALSIESMSYDYFEKDLDILIQSDWAKERLARIRLPLLKNDPRDFSQGLLLKASTTDWLALDSGHTSHFVTADCSGLTVSVTQTLGPLFGAKVATPTLGFPYAATMGGYLRTGKQDPGSRPRTSIAPVIITKESQVVLALGAAGGIKIPSAIVQVISRFIDRGESLDTALARPRVHPVSTIDERNQRQTKVQHFQAETTADGWTPADVASWRRAGFEVTEVERKASFARVHALQNRDGVLTGSADPDWEGSSLPPVSCIGGKE